MRKLTVGELMTRGVVTVAPDTSFAELVGLMVYRDLDVLPVIDSVGRPVGVVSERDLVAKLEFHAGVDQCPMLASGRLRARWRKAIARTARELMSSPVVTRDAPKNRVEVTVEDGVGRLAGTVRLPQHRRWLLRRARLVPGLVGPESRVRRSASMASASYATTSPTAPSTFGPR